MIQWSYKFKIIDKEKLLKLQNEQRKKYGLKAHKRLDTEFLYLQSDTETQKRDTPCENGVMYQ